MKLDGEIILIDNDRFEEDLLSDALEQLNYSVRVVYLNTPKAGFEYLKQTDKTIFLIISEMDFKGMTGMDLKKAINEEENTQYKSIPFIFIANSATKAAIEEAYKYDIHGFFRKPKEHGELKELFSVIIKYWIWNVHPHKDERFYD